MFEVSRMMIKIAGGIKAENEMEVFLGSYWPDPHLRNQTQLTHEIAALSDSWKCTSYTGEAKALILQELHCG